ncbi:MAG: nitroreductase [Clostridiales bacterium]|nr:nitroreductase [Clostridiales bacterium]
MTEQMRQAMKERHTVRQFDGTPLTDAEKSILRSRVDELNKQYDLSIALIESEKSPLSFLGKTLMGGAGVYSYFVLAADDRDGEDEMLGYAGSDLCLYAQMNGLNTWWMAGTFNRRFVEGLVSGKKIVSIIAAGHGKTQGVPHKSKRPDQVSSYEGEAPEWFNNGVQAALLAPTALNMQAFTITGKGNTVSLTYKSGPMSGIDKGIVKHHFELGAGKENFEWA